jgi:tetratricopeptide (TPR) repeat protein
MSLRKKIGFGLLGLALVGVAFGIARARPYNTVAAQYADSPFHPVGKDFPRIIPVREFPTDRAAQEAYRKETKARREYLLTGGGMQKATNEDREALRLVLVEMQYIKGRELAFQILQNNSASLPALYVLARAEYLGEGNLPGALYRVRQLRHRMEKAGQANPDDVESRDWYIRALDLEYRILSALSHNEEQLRVVDLLEQVYQPMTWLRIFPLIKLKRLDEAQRCLDQVNPKEWPISCLNDRLILAAVRRDRQAGYQAGKDVYKTNPPSAVLWSNAGETALSAFHINEAEEAFIRSATQAEQDFNGSAYTRLARLYLQQGRFPEAIDALKKAKRQRYQRPAHTLQQDHSLSDRAMASVLLMLGKGEDALRVARRAWERPGRLGHNTQSEESDQLNNGLVFWAALQNRIEQIREANAGQGIPGLDAEVRALQAEAWRVQRQMLKLLADPVLLDEMLRPYMPGQEDKDAWLTGPILQVLPSGVAAEAVRRARHRETDPAAAPYFDAMEAEVALAQGDFAQALQRGKDALTRLPAEGEKLLRARVGVIAGEAARRLGRPNECLTVWTPVLSDGPQMFRALGIALPVRIEHDNTPMAAQLVRQLLASPRCRDDQAGFKVVIQTAGDQLRFAMYRGEALHFQGSVQVKEADTVARAMKRFHEHLMSPLMDLSQSQINSLDGSASASPALGG